VRSSTLIGTWWPGILIIASIILAISTPINPWLIGAVTGVTIVIVFAISALRRSSERRRAAQGRQTH
jgi:uncharacterized membrane protein SirB2